MPRVYRLEFERHVRPPTPGESARGRATLDVQHLAERVSAQIRQLGNVLVQPWNRDVLVAARHGHQRDRLVRRAFHEELDLAVLIRRAKRAERRRPHVLRAFLLLLAEALGPELHEPLGHDAPRIATGYPEVD